MTAASTAAEAPSARLAAVDLELGYGRAPIVAGLGLEIRDGELTVVIGPNACGKSTLLRGLARLMPPASGTVLLDGEDIAKRPTRDVARVLGLLPQTSTAPAGIRVVDLVCRGRFAHQRFLRRWGEEDHAAVARAMSLARVDALAERAVDELSGGQRQRVWLAAALAQDTELLLLDEPTTYLDPSHQLEVMELCAALRDEGRTIVAVLHDLNQAARFADRIVAMREGGIVADGAPREVVTPELLADVFRIEAVVERDPLGGGPLVIPIRSLAGRDRAAESDGARAGAESPAAVRDARDAE